MALFRVAHTMFTEANIKQRLWVPAGGWANADFNTAQRLVKNAEGGYSNNPNDPGNWTGGKINSGSLVGTNYGISAPVLKTFLGREPSVDDMKNLDYTTAVGIFKSNYWNPIQGDSINDQDVANILYDAAVNQGTGTAKKYANDSLGVSTYSVQAINNSNSKTLFNKIGAERYKHYISLGGYALNSWLSRLADLGYAGAGVVKRHIVETIAITLGVAGLVGLGIYLIRKK